MKPIVFSLAVLAVMVFSSSVWRYWKDGQKIICFYFSLFLFLEALEFRSNVVEEEAHGFTFFLLEIRLRPLFGKEISALYENSHEKMEQLFPCTAFILSAYSFIFLLYIFSMKNPQDVFGQITSKKLAAEQLWELKTVIEKKNTIWCMYFIEPSSIHYTIYSNSTLMYMSLYKNSMKSISPLHCLHH